MLDSEVCVRECERIGVLYSSMHASSCPPAPRGCLRSASGWEGAKVTRGGTGRTQMASKQQPEQGLVSSVGASEVDASRDRISSSRMTTDHTHGSTDTNIRCSESTFGVETSWR